MSNPSFREKVRSFLPTWLLDRTSIGKTAGFRIIYSFMAILDAGAQVAIEGLQSRMPGLGTPTALPLIGKDRQIVQGPGEYNENYANRLIKWLDYWKIAGNAYSLMIAFQAYLAPNYPMIRLVTRDRPGYGSIWYTLNTDGTLDIERVNPSNWDWDSISNPERDGYWSDFWIVAFEPHYGKDGLWGDGNSYWYPGADVGKGQTFGQDPTYNSAQLLRSIVTQWKGAHTKCRCMIFSYRSNAYDPALPPGDPLLPDGKWGKYGKDDGSGGRIKSRDETDRYWDNIDQL